MEQRISLITLGVQDVARAVTFYKDVVGWSPAPGPPDIAFFDLNGVIFSLYAHTDLAQDMATSASEPGDYQGFALAHNVASAGEVDAIFARLRERGATIVKSPRKAPWGGYSGYFRDLDGHRWEVAYNPYWTIRADGRISLVRDTQADDKG